MRMNGIEWGVGQESAISLSYQYFRKPFRVNGEILRRTSEGIGVEFKTAYRDRKKAIRFLKEAA